jgi:hypothetical protein
MRILKTNPVLTILNSYLIDSPEPSTISYLWNFGSLLGLCLVAQIVSGILLAMHYAGTAELAFHSVEHKFNHFVDTIFNNNKILLKEIYLYSNVNNIEENNKNIKELIQTKRQNIENNNFYEWFRGLVDGEGCFSIIPIKRNNNISFNFRFVINLHKDDIFMLQTIHNKLNIGSVYEYKGNHFAQYSVTKKNDLLIIFNIFDNNPLNRTKNLNYLAFKEAYLLWLKKKKKILI